MDASFSASFSRLNDLLAHNGIIERRERRLALANDILKKVPVYLEDGVRVGLVRVTVDSCSLIHDPVVKAVPRRAFGANHLDVEGPTVA